MDSTITNLEQLKTLYGAPKSTSIKKQSATLTDAYQQWLEQSCFFVIASVGTDGVDCTPRGDKHGDAFSIIDNKTIVIPDRRGNNRLDTLSNIVLDSRVALLFFIPGIEQTLRVIGYATITTDETFLDQFRLADGKPIACIHVSIESVYFQNARAIARAQLWNQAALRGPESVPTPGEMVQSVDPDFDPNEYDAG